MGCAAALPFEELAAAATPFAFYLGIKISC